MSRSALLLLLLAGLLIVSCVFSLGAGAVKIPVSDLWEILIGSESARRSDQALIVWKLRFPRVVLSVLVGAGLGAAGAGFQGLFRNPLADPFVIGASSGAALGGVLALVFGFGTTLLAYGAVSGAALTGALLAVTIVYAIASVGRDTPILSLLLAGVAVSNFLGAVVSLLMFLNNQQLVVLLGWLMGSTARSTWPVVSVTCVLVVLSTIVLWLCSRPLDALTFGEETAAGLGLRVSRFRATVVIAATVATASSVAACGIIGFVGLVAPHVARLMVGARHAVVIPASALSGSLLLLWADDMARTIMAPMELPVGVVTALVGSPFFIYLLIANRKTPGV